MARLGPGLLLLLLATAAAVLAEDWKCRMDPDSAYVGCGLPYQLSNFQGYYACDPSVKLGHPKSVEEMAKLVSQFPKVKAVGVGGSWAPDLFCAGTDASALNIVTTELEPTLNFIKSAPTPQAAAPNCKADDEFPIHVDEEEQTVTVAAGIPQRMLLDYLAGYRHCKQPKGWTLPAFTWWTDQTMGGAVATNSHGSSMKYGSLSSQVLSLDLLLGNGTVISLTPQSNPHLFKAAIVSVGRLGIVTKLTFRIKPQMAVTKSLQELNHEQFARQIKATQDKYNAAKAAGDEAAMKKALYELDETQALWIVESNAVWRTDFSHIEHEPLSVLLNTADDEQRGVEAMAGPEYGPAVLSQKKHSPVPKNSQMTSNPGNRWGRFYATLGREYVVPGTWEARRSFLAMTEQGTRLTSTFAPYTQYEVAVPLEVAGDCFLGLNKEVYGPKNLKEGFRNPALVRFVTGEDAYLSNNVDGPHMWVNMEDWISLSDTKANQKFLDVMRYYRDKCKARFHLGKAGWNDVQVEGGRCFDGAKAYPQTWCHFGCAAAELDPANKFTGSGKGAAYIWHFQAKRAGAEVPFASCCTPQGFSAECECAPRPSCS